MKYATSLKLNDSFKELTMRKLEVKPQMIEKCQDKCQCQICSRNTPLNKHKKSTSVKFTNPMRRNSIQNFNDDFLFVVTRLQKVDEVVRPLNVNIQDTLFLHNREATLLVYYENGLQFIKHKITLNLEMERFFTQRMNEYNYDKLIRQIVNNEHPTILSGEFYEFKELITQKLKRQVQHYSNDRPIILARYQNQDSIIMAQYQLHQLQVLSKANQIYDNLIQLQLYCHDATIGVINAKEETRNPYDIMIHPHIFEFDKKLYEQIILDIPVLQNPTLSGTQLWEQEYLYSLKLDFQEYCKYTSHKIVAYLDCFHSLLITQMTVDFVINYPNNISIVNITKLKYKASTDNDWMVKRTRHKNVTNKFDMDEDFSQRRPMTDRVRAISDQMGTHSQQIFDRIKGVNEVIKSETQRDSKSDDAFQILNPKVNIPLSQILQQFKITHLLSNFPKQLKKFKQFNNPTVIKKKQVIEDKPLPPKLEDYMLKKQVRQTKNSTPPIRRFTRRFFNDSQFQQSQ